MRERSFHEIFPTTAFLLLFVVAFFALELIAHRLVTDGEIPGLLGSIHPRATDLLGSVSWARVRQGDYWRLLSAAFLHGNYIHILFSIMILSDVGRFCEPRVSSWKFLVIYVCCALGGSVGSLLWSSLTPGGEFRSSVGASGALCGLIGIMLVYSLRQRHRELRDELLRWIGFIVVVSFFMPRIDHAGHVGGFIVGALFGLTVKDYMTSRQASRWRYPGYVALVVLLTSLGAAVWNYFGSDLRG